MVGVVIRRIEKVKMAFSRKGEHIGLVKGGWVGCSMVVSGGLQSGGKLVREKAEPKIGSIKPPLMLWYQCYGMLLFSRQTPPLDPPAV